MLLALALAAQATAATPPADDAAMFGRMVALYDTVCLKRFPRDDDAAEAVVGAGGQALPAMQLRTYLYGGHGQGWRVADGGSAFIVTIEDAPYHQCSVRRWTAGGVNDVSAYRSVADAYETAHPGFTTIEPQTFKQQDGVSSKGMGEVLKGGQASESLMLFSSNPVKQGDASGTEVRLVHLYHSGSADPSAKAE
jgi:hypothetical protein